MKKNPYKILFASFLMFMCCGAAMAQLRLPFIIGSNMVLQCDRPVPVWGYARAGEQVTVQFKQQQKTATADGDGKWRVELNPLPVATQPADMIIKVKDSIIRLQNILVGEVWLCSGQSNMEYSMRKNSKFEKALRGSAPENELEKANNPLIRIFLVRNDFSKPHPLRHTWDTAAGVPLRDFSAAGYFFAKELYRRLNIPIGIISSAVPGSRIEPWMPPGGMVREDTSHGSDSAGGSETGKFYQTMIAPLAPFALRGFLWYQGESNCFLNDTVQYTGQMQALILSWRSLWNNPALSFYYVQIAPFYYSRSKDGRPHSEQTLAEFRWAQTLAQRMPHTGMITTTDLVDHPEDIHPAYKWEIGRRLALLALAKDYQKKIEYSGPAAHSLKTAGNRLILTFDHADGGLVSNDGKQLTWFSIAGKDSVFVSATAVIKGHQVILTAAGVNNPTDVKFAWNEAAQPNLFNKQGLPAIPYNSLKRVDD